MATEIERKFLVKGDFSRQVTSAQRIVQGYICSQPGRTVRIRIRGEEGFLTIKGASDEKGLSRYEFEQKIPLADAEELLKLCEPGAIDKVRNLVPRAISISVFMSQSSLRCRLRDAEMVFSMSMARVMGPTPPGTGVI